jgi:hypothetical protein
VSLAAVVCRRGFIDLPLRLEQRAEVEDPVQNAALTRPPVGVLGADQIALLLENHPDVACGASMTALIGANQRRPSRGVEALPVKQNAEPERRLRDAGRIAAEVSRLSPG